MPFDDPDHPKTVGEAGEAPRGRAASGAHAAPQRGGNYLKGGEKSVQPFEKSVKASKKALHPFFIKEKINCLVNIVAA